MNAAGAIPPIEPIQSSYIPPSPQARIDPQNLAPRNLSSHFSYNSSTPSNRSVPLRPPHQYQMTYGPPPGLSQPSTMASMASTAPMMAGTSPLWLEPKLQHRELRHDPFLRNKNSGLGPSSSQSKISSSRSNIMSSNPGPASYASNTMGNYLGDIPSKKSEDRCEIRQIQRHISFLTIASEPAATTSLSVSSPLIAGPVEWAREIAVSSTHPLSYNYHSTTSTQPRKPTWTP